MSVPRDRQDDYKQQVIAALGDFSRIYGGLKNAKPSGKNQMMACCPFHEDKHPSFGYSTENGRWKCFASCGNGDVFGFEMKRTGETFVQVLNRLGDELGISRPDDQQVTYDYLDENRALLFQVVRRPGKKFAQRKPAGGGQWEWSIKGVRRVLYRLPDLISKAEETVYVVEGEKDAEQLIQDGLMATTCSGGAGKWRAEYSECLRDRDVVILPDNDEPGRNHALQVARSLFGIVGAVKIVELPGLPDKGDVSDWLGQGHGVAELLQLVEAADELVPDVVRPRIQAAQQQLNVIIPDAWSALLAQNDPPQLFKSAGSLARIVTADGTPRIEHASEDTAYGLLIRIADWYVIERGDERDTKPPRDVAKDILAFPDDALPELEAVVTTPVFDRHGRLISEPGYHAHAKLWMHAVGGEAPVQVPTKPTEAEIDRALELLTEHLLVDFPFTEESDQAHALAAILLPFVRRMIDGPTPVHLIEAPTPGSGKSLLAELVSIVATGRSCESTTVTRNEDESRKKLTAILSRGNQIVVIDNVKGGLESAQLASAITAEIWSDRILGKTQMVDFPNRALWLVTGNNPKLTMEIARRCVRVRLEPVEERPWERVTFTHDPIREWAKEHRQSLVWAVLVIVQGWVASGMKPGAKTIGSFESWARVIGGILHHAGVPGFLEDTEKLYDMADTEGTEWRAFTTIWWERLGSSPVGVRELLELADKHDLIGFAYSARTEAAQRQRLGHALSAQRDRRYGDLKIMVGENRKAKTNSYRLVAMTGDMFNEGTGS